MILLFALAMQSAALPAATCAALVKSDPAAAVAHANDWRVKGGGLDARQCLGLAYSALDRWPAAATEFEAGARAAETLRDRRGADLWAQSGNAWLAAGDGVKAKKALDAALAATTLTGELRGEAHLDRARAGVALGDLPGARVDLDKALVLVPADPFAWYASAALAQREGDAPRAKADIARALALAPDDPDVKELAAAL